jgi:hypothetical protein
MTNADLDQYHGHVHATADYPQGIYHYHVTAAAPYINDTGFYGTAGTVSYQFSASPTPSPTNTPTATSTAAPVPSVGGIAQDPGLLQVPAQPRATSHASTIQLAALASAALAAMLICGSWYIARRRNRQT